jgi:hypothetical protein
VLIFSDLQTAPYLTGGGAVQDLVIADVYERMQHGIRKYGTALQVGNGRDMLQDAYEEALDLSVYLRGLVEQQRQEALGQGEPSLGRRVLAVPVAAGDHGGPTTIGGWLTRLLGVLWDEQEGFSGKRPWGNSGWDSDVEAALIRAGLVDGELDSDGFIERVDSREADRLIRLAIGELR